MPDDPPLYRQVAAELLMQPFVASPIDDYQVLPAVEPATAPIPVIPPGGSLGRITERLDRE